MSCYNCGHRVIGLGCTRKGLDNAKRVTDHDHCAHWQPEDNPDTVIGKEIAHTRRFDKDIPAGYLKPIILDLGRDMNKEEILAMEAGKELDHLVMKEIFNASMGYYGEEEVWYHYDSNGEPDYEWSSRNRPSTDISAAWEVVEKMRERFDWVGIDTVQKLKYRCLIVDRIILDGQETSGECFADTAPEAICKAALLAVAES